MPLVYVHVSDIHFGQEKDGRIYPHDDVRQELIYDAARIVKDRAGGQAAGIIVTGDIAYSGKEDEYKKAGAWLDSLAEAVRCLRSKVLMVPGNHDVDRACETEAGTYIIDQIRAGGQDRLHKFLSSEADCNVLYEPLKQYADFAGAYNCPLDKSGGYACNRVVELAPNRSLRFVGLNSVIASRPGDKEKDLILGTKQHPIPRTEHEEVVLMCNHPLRWFKDEERMVRYVKSRVRVFLTGHEHAPSMNKSAVEPGCDLLTVSAGAAVPYEQEPGYTYTYNVLIFDWNEAEEALVVTLIPRIWSDDKMAFEADVECFGGSETVHVLGSPNFRMGTDTKSATASSDGTAQASHDAADNSPAVSTRSGESSSDETLPPPISTDEALTEGTSRPVPIMTDRFELLLLRYFRDLSAEQRLGVLKRLKLLPDWWKEDLNQSMERDLVLGLTGGQSLDEFESSINQAQQ